ncbi:MAG: hypothetical protein GX660_09715 [Clostridiaceae bacterium]|nr:hypothetical protein [Clostridiaceae bacterium]
MENWLLFINSVIFTYSGFTIGLYGILAKEMINKIGAKMADYKYSEDEDENAHYYSLQIEKWKTGILLGSPFALIVGIIISIGGSLICLIENAWWTVLLSLITGYFLYLRVSYVFVWRVQLISVICFLGGIILFLTQMIIG